LATKGYGESQPKASNLDEAGRAANRRVEIRLVPVTEG
jgi:outer membrane protein OmpA-like peptidoglycan-associated protein